MVYARWSFILLLRSSTFDILDQAMHLGGGDKNAWGHVGMMLQSLSLLAVQYGLGTAMLEAWGNLGNCATCHGLAGDVDCIKQRFRACSSHKMRTLTIPVHAIQPFRNMHQRQKHRRQTSARPLNLGFNALGFLFDADHR